MEQPDLSEASEITLTKVGDKWYYSDGENFWRVRMDFFAISRDQMTAQASRLEEEKTRIDEKISSVNDEIAALEGAFEEF